MNTVIQRILGIATASPRAARLADKLTLEQLRERLQNIISDCGGMRAQRLAYKIDGSRLASDLWLLRTDLHQCISQEHSQSVAVARINELVPAFQGWIPASQLTRI